MFVWDGTELTEQLKNAEIFEATYNKKIYWKIKVLYNNLLYEETCIVRSSKGSITALIDEIKIVFGLPKLGTHWIKKDNKFKLLIRCPKTQGYIKDEQSLKDYLKTNTSNCLLEMQIREIYAFRELLGVTRTYDSSITMRKGKNGIYPLSFYEPNMTSIDHKVVPSTVLEKWFEETDLDVAISKLTKIRTIDDITVRLHEIRRDIEKIILRIDKELILFLDHILTRIISRAHSIY